jgi:chromosome segregation protein
MLKLHSLEISGFKSFVDPVKVRFAGGTTAIVGPNGCGKSNLADAITWVLGEQSAKTLRGATMEDVIFNGTDRRKPVGMADVTLTMLSDPGSAHAVDGRIRISRRVFRTGVSQYRLNGKVVRLKEVKDLLMDTGLGIRAYSVIEQGKIGMILSGKPQERRKLLEEAAGITRYKQRKRLAEIKLEEATANLVRLDDIVSEVERALRSLKRQASAARRYQAKEREYRQLLQQVLLGRWSLTRDRLAGLEESLAELTDRDAEVSAALHSTEAELARGREDLDRLASALAERHQQHAELAATIEGRQEFLKGSRQRREEMEDRRERGRKAAAERQQQLKVFELSLGNLDERTRDLLDERDEAARRVAEDDAEIAAAHKAVEAEQKRLEDLRQEILAAISALNLARAALQREHVEVEKRTYRQRFLGEEQQRLDRQQREAAAALAAIDDQLARVQEELGERSGRLEGLTAELDELLDRESELGDRRRQLESRLDRLADRQSILVELSEEHAERRRVLVENLRSIGIAAPRFLAEMATPAAGWEESIDHFLGDLADAVVLDPGADGLALARALAEAGASGVFLRPLDADAGKAPEDASAGSLAKAMPVEDRALCQPLSVALGLPAEVARALPPAYLVSSAADAARLAARHPGVAFLSRERLWAVGGTLRVQAEAAAPGVLARERELDSIAEEIPDLEEQLAETAAGLDETVAERTRCASERHRVEENVAELRREQAVAQARRSDAAARESKLRQELATVVEEQQEIALELGDRSARQEQLGAEVGRAEEAHAELNRGFEAAQAEVETLKERREALRTAGAGRRGRLELLEERIDSHHHEISGVRRQSTEAEEQLETWAREEADLAEQMRDLDAAMAGAEEELQGALEQRAAAQEGVLRQQEILDAKRAELRGLEARVSETRTAREELRTEIEDHRVDRASLRQDAEHLAVTYAEEFKRGLPGIGRFRPAADAGSAEVAPALEEAEEDAESAEEAEIADIAPVPEEADQDRDDDVEDYDEDEDEEIAAMPAVLEEDDVEVPSIAPSDLAELEADLSRVKTILERLGPVNVLAAKEYEEQEERREFLTTQRRDVAESVESLKITIHEINETSSERFRATFAEVNERFGRMFTKLFRGGEAEMRLFDEEDLLESGIEIIARPPGKRFQNIMLLSGGEKALTAVALLFALFQTKPSPFCILDEVDAPLDDVNVLRFVDTLKDLAEETQFLIITHNKLTMEVAATLYGVTMEERGVSKLVSVELDKIHADEGLQAASA